MSRIYNDWLKAYVDYASYGEAPKHMAFWCGVSAVAGALRRRVWIDQAYFKWYANMYVVLVAPPGIVSKTTTADVAMELLREVPGVKFGPNVVTWQSLVKSFADAGEAFQDHQGDWITMSPLTLFSGEFGNLMNPHDRDMVDLMVTLWDGIKTFRKETKMSGNDTVENPWINLLACTTPAWIAGNFPDYLIGGGFTSRCLFVYAEQKAKYVAYPALEVPANRDKTQANLIHDLEHIATQIVGPYELDSAAIQWGKAWYEKHYQNRPEGLDDERFGGYIARKQTHIHKVAMILAASQRDARVILTEDLVAANQMVTELEEDMPRVFAKIGRTETSVQADRFIEYVHKRGAVAYQDAYRYIHAYFPDVHDFEGIVSGAIKAGYMTLKQNQTTMAYYLEWTGDKT